MVVCLERGADLHVAQLMPLPLTVSCFSKILIGFVPAHLGSPGNRAVKRVCVCVGEWIPWGEVESYYLPLTKAGAVHKVLVLACSPRWKQIHRVAKKVDTKLRAVTL